MGTYGNNLIRGMEPEMIAERLDSLYAFEMVAFHWLTAVHNRLHGMALVLLHEELTQKAEAGLSRARKLADRIGQQGGAVTAAPSDFYKTAPISEYTLPARTGEAAEILSHALRYEP